jgi:hypothetical protein
MRSGAKPLRTGHRGTQPGMSTDQRKRWLFPASRLVPKGFQSVKRNYERYLALARAEAQIGYKVAAERYYQHAENYFRSMSSDLRET